MDLFSTELRIRLSFVKTLEFFFFLGGGLLINDMNKQDKLCDVFATTSITFS
jgi:hypothetical protein